MVLIVRERQRQKKTYSTWRPFYETGSHGG